MLKIRFLPARFGDSIWIEYGGENARHRLLVDGGTRGTRNDIRAQLAALPEDERRFELMVISHIDRDHLEGILGLLDDDQLGFEVGDLWFNGWPHLPDNPEDEPFGAVQGERLTARILAHALPWNRAFDGKAVVVPDDGPLPEILLPGDLRITLLSPPSLALTELKPVWEQEVREHNLDPGFGLAANDDVQPDEDEHLGPDEIPDLEALADSPFEADDSEANGSSIAFLVEHDGKRVLLSADAHVGTLRNALDRLSPGQRVRLDLFKISHHGSKTTTSRELIEKVNCPRFVFSTNGSVFRHPHAETMARVLAATEQPELVFNYRSARNEIWDLELLKQQHNYRTLYPAAGAEGIELEL